MAATVIKFPQQQEEYVTISRAELQAMIAEAVRSAITDTKPKKIHMTTEERQQKLSPFKSNGGKKATAAQPLTNAEEIKAVRGYFLTKGMYREYAIFSVGLTLGIRANDLLDLEIGDFIDEDGSFKERLDVIEMKTDKRNRPLLTEYAKQALTLYLEHRNKRYSPKDKMFITNRGTACSLSFYNQKLAQAGEALGIHLSSHCMRHTFAYLMNTHGPSETANSLDYMSLLMTQMAMNHSHLSQTLSYTGLSQTMMDEKRIAISEYLLANT